MGPPRNRLLPPLLLLFACAAVLMAWANVTLGLAVLLTVNLGATFASFTAASSGAHLGVLGRAFLASQPLQVLSGDPACCVRWVCWAGLGFLASHLAVALLPADPAGRAGQSVPGVAAPAGRGACPSALHTLAVVGLGSVYSRAHCLAAAGLWN